jgi:hypothetical protein
VTFFCIARVLLADCATLNHWPFSRPDQEARCAAKIFVTRDAEPRREKLKFTTEPTARLSRNQGPDDLHQANLKPPMNADLPSPAEAGFAKSSERR